MELSAPAKDEILSVLDQLVATRQRGKPASTPTRQTLTIVADHWLLQSLLCWRWQTTRVVLESCKSASRYLMVTKLLGFFICIGVAHRHLKLNHSADLSPLSPDLVLHLLQFYLDLIWTIQKWIYCHLCRIYKNLVLHLTPLLQFNPDLIQFDTEYILLPYMYYVRQFNLWFLTM